VLDPTIDPPRLKREFQSILKEQCTRLEELRTAHEAEEADEATDVPEGSAFDDSAEGERLHRYQMHWHRSLLRTIDAIAKLKKCEEQEASDDRGAGCQSCQSVDQEKAGSASCPTGMATSESCPTGMATSESCPTKSVQNKPIAMTEPDGRRRTYATATRSGEKLGPAGKQRPEGDSWLDLDAAAPHPGSAPIPGGAVVGPRAG
jgi:hypothetical protein